MVCQVTMWAACALVNVPLVVFRCASAVVLFLQMETKTRGWNWIPEPSRRGQLHSNYTYQDVSPPPFSFLLLLLSFYSGCILLLYACVFLCSMLLYYSSFSHALLTSVAVLFLLISCPLILFSLLFYLSYLSFDTIFLSCSYVLFLWFSFLFFIFPLVFYLFPLTLCSVFYSLSLGCFSRSFFFLYCSLYLFFCIALFSFVLISLIFCTYEMPVWAIW